MTAKEYIDNLFGEKSYTHSPFSVYRSELYTWLEEYADLKAKEAFTASAEMHTDHREQWDSMELITYEQWKESQTKKQ